MYYKGYDVRVAISKYKETGYIQALLVTRTNDVVEEITVNPINMIADCVSANNSEASPMFMIKRKEFEHVEFTTLYTRTTDIVLTQGIKTFNVLKLNV